MSTTNLSQRLRELKAMCITHGERHSIPNETAHWLMVGAVDELEKAIAQAEAQEGRAYFEGRVKPSSDDPEAQAGELSVERIMQAVKRAGSQMPYGHINYDMIRAELTKNGPVVAHLNMDPNASPETIEAVKDMVHAAYSYKPSQAIGEQTPVAKPNDWSNPEFRAKTFLERMRRLRADVSMWQGKCSVLRHENNRLRAKPSPEARDKAIERLDHRNIGTIAGLYHKQPTPADRPLGRVFDHETAHFVIDYALSALRAQ